MLKDWISEIQNGNDLDENSARACVLELFSGECGEDEIVTLLAALADKGESVSEITGFASGLLEKCVKVPAAVACADLCGTGGTGRTRFNVSTTAAFVIASAGIPVAKHGNRGSKAPNGSFDLIEKLGIRFDTTPAEEAAALEEHNLCFIFARSHHPAMRHVGPARMKLARRSIFNLVGPLSNPAGAQTQLLGVSDPRTAEKIANALLALGKTKALVVHGHPGIDELSVSGKSEGLLVSNGTVSPFSFTPERVGLSPVNPERLPGGNVDENAESFLRLLEGEKLNGLSDMVCLNAGTVVWLAGRADSVEEGYKLAGELLASGKAKTCFEEYRKAFSAE